MSSAMEMAQSIYDVLPLSLSGDMVEMSIIAGIPMMMKMSCLLIKYMLLPYLL